MTYRHISPELLDLTIDSLIDAGTSEYDIRSLIFAFTPADLVGDASAADDTVGFLGVHDIPARSRAEFLELLLELDPRRAPPPPVQTMATAERRSLVGRAVGVWQSARTAVATAMKPVAPAHGLPLKRGSTARLTFRQ